MELFILKALESSGYGEADYIIGIFSTVEKAEEAWSNYQQSWDDSGMENMYVKSISVKILDEL